MDARSALRVQCRNCGASLTYSPAERSLTCEFCGAVVDIVRSDEVVPAIADSDSIVPLAVDADTLERVTLRYMSTGDFTPDDLLQEALIVVKTISYVPAYIFSGSYTAQWTASFGYDRTEQYVEYRNGKPETRRQTVTDWKPVNGVDAGSFAVPVYAGKAIEPRAAELVERMELSPNLTGFRPEYLAGIEAEPYSLKPREAFESKGESGVNAMIDEKVKSHAQGDRQRDWHWTAQLDRSTVRALLPVGHCVFEYRGKEYHVWVDGSDGKRMACDPLPVDNRRRSSVAVGYVPLVVSLLAVVAAFVRHLQPFNLYVLAAVVVAGLYAFFRKRQLLGHSKAVRASVLAHKAASTVSADRLGRVEREAIASGIARPKVPLLADTARDRFVIPLLSILLAAMVMLSAFHFQDKGFQGRDEHERIIAGFVQAEDRRDYGELSGYLSDGMRRYWDIYSPTPEQVEKRYRHIWSVTDYSKNRIREIERVNDSTYVMRTRYEFKGSRRKTVTVQQSRVCFVFGPDLKIREIYGME